MTSAISDSERIAAVFDRVEEIHAVLIGTMERRGIIRRVEDIEKAQKASWWLERATKIVDALILAGAVIIVSNGLEGTIRDVVGEARGTYSTARRTPIPMPSDCPGCKDAVAPARMTRLDNEDDGP